MAGNSNPIFGRVGNVKGVALTAANTKSDGTGTIGTDLFLCFSSDTTNGSWISKVRATVAASAASTLTNATTVRFYLSNLASGSTTPGTNIWQLEEIALAALTVDVNNSTFPPQEKPIGIAIPATWFVYASTHTASAASTQAQAIVVGTDY